MDLRSIANSLTQVVNNNVFAQLWASTGNSTASTGKRTPIYTKSTIIVQVQALSYSDLQKLDNLNIQGVRRKIYVSSQVFSLVRVAQKGGDLLVFAANTPGVPEGSTWLCVHVLEAWTDWCTFAITLQNDNLTPTPPFP